MLAFLLRVEIFKALELLRPTVVRAALEARELELDADTVLALFAELLKR